MKNFTFIINFLTLIAFTSCTKAQESLIRIVVQPEVEVDKSTMLSIYFTQKPDSVWTDFKDNKRLEFAVDLNESLKDLYLDNYNSEVRVPNYIIPLKIGKLDFPIIHYTYKGKQYHSNSFTIESVRKPNINDQSIIIKYNTDKKQYNINDTITLSLNLYSKYFDTRSNLKLLKHLKSPNDEPRDDKTKAFIEYISSNFKVINAREIYTDDDYKEVTEINNSKYIKSLQYEINLLPKKEGNYTIPTLQSDYTIISNITDYAEAYQISDLIERDKYFERTFTKRTITSNEISFKVQ